MSIINNEARSRWVEELSNHISRSKARDLVVRIAGAKGLSNTSQPKTSSEVEDTITKASELLDEIVRPSLDDVEYDTVKNDLLAALEEELTEEVPDDINETPPPHIQLGYSKAETIQYIGSSTQLKVIIGVGDEARYGDENLVTDAQVDSLIEVLGSSPTLVQRASSRTLFEISQAQPKMLENRLDELTPYVSHPSCHQYLVPAIASIFESDVELSTDDIREMSEVLANALSSSELDVQYTVLSVLETIVDSETECIADVAIDRLLDVRNAPNPQVASVATTLIERLDENGVLDTHRYRVSVPGKQKKSAEMANYTSKGPWKTPADKDEDPSTFGMDPSMHSNI